MNNLKNEENHMQLMGLPIHNTNDEIRRLILMVENRLNLVRVHANTF
jgi:hypothetical protein